MVSESWPSFVLVGALAFSATTLLTGCARAIEVPVGVVGVAQPVAAGVKVALPVPPVCPPIPDDIRREVLRETPEPDSELAGRDRVAGEAIVSELRRARALDDLSKIYDDCREPRK